MFLPKSNTFYTSREIDDNIKITVHSLKEGYVSRLHWHDYYEIEIILEGRGTHSLNNIRYEIGPGSAFLLSFKDFHSITANSDLKVLNISFSADTVDERLTACLTADFNKTCFFKEKEIEYIKMQLENLEHFKSNNNFYKILQRNYLNELIIKIINNKNIETASLNASSVQKAVEIINNEFNNDITLEYVANKVFLTPNYLGSVFKKSVGCSFRDFLNAVRIRYACNLLISTQRPIKKISTDCGFNSVEYFAYIFKKQMNMSASEFKAKHK